MERNSWHRPAFLSVEEASGASIRAQRDGAWLERTLSGCDWCCGGGREEMAEISKIAASSKHYLNIRGIREPILNACEMCRYGMPTVDTAASCEIWENNLCGKCYTAIRGGDLCA